MKNVLIIYIVTIMTTAISYSQAQSIDSPISYDYAEATIKYSGTGKHKATDLNFGSKFQIEIENREQIIEKCEEFETGVDIMNYMSNQGWECFNTQIILSTYVTFYVYQFRKLKNK